MTEHDPYLWLEEVEGVRVLEYTFLWDALSATS